MPLFIQKEKKKTQQTVLPKEKESHAFEGLECLTELREDDIPTQIQFRDCQIDYSLCPNQKCIKKLV